jgi:PPP family 3-phenylpropionic acid transporter
MSEKVIFKNISIENEKKEAVKFAGLEFTYWAAMSVGSFLTVFLQSIGFTASQVGIVNAANSAVGIVSGPIWGMLSDKLQSIKRTMLACIVFAMILQVFIPASTTVTIFGVSLIMLYMPFVSFFMNPTMILLDSWAIQSSHKNGFTYSIVRSTGSLSWAVAGIIVSLILRRTGGGVTNTFYIAAAMMIPVFALALITRNATADSDSERRTLSFREMHLGALFKNYYFTAYLFYTFIVNIAFMSGFAFYSYLIKDVGGNITQMGIINGISAGV